MFQRLKETALSKKQSFSQQNRAAIIIRKARVFLTEQWRLLVGHRECQGSLANVKRP